VDVVGKLQGRVRISKTSAGCGGPCCTGPTGCCGCPVLPVSPTLTFDNPRRGLVNCSFLIKQVRLALAKRGIARKNPQFSPRPNPQTHHQHCRLIKEDMKKIIILNRRKAYEEPRFCHSDSSLSTNVVDLRRAAMPFR